MSAPSARMHGREATRMRVRKALGEALRTALPPWRSIGPTLLYCLRTLAAIGVALYTAFALQLQSPLSSVITVLIVANPVTGALVSKSLWRLSGTFIGAAAAVLAMACFAQAPMLFAIMFSLWIGLACIASTLLRFFKAYGAVLAGYTIVIVCAPAFDDPDNVFTSALSRLSAVSVGIASAAMVFLLTSIRPPSRLGDASLALIRDTGAALCGHAAPAYAADPRSWRRADPGGLPDAFYDRRGALLAQASGLHETIEYAAADSFEVSHRAARLRLGAAGLMGTLTALDPFYGRLGPHRALAAELRAAIGGLALLRPEAPGPVLDRLAGLRDRLSAGDDTLSSLALHADLDQFGAIEHARDLLGRLHDAISNLTISPDAPKPGAPKPGAPSRGPRLRRFLDWPTALRNGARGSIVTMLAFLFWYVTQWPSGPTLLSYLVPASCLLATNPSASRASIDFSIGTLLAIPASYVCESLLLPQISGFPLLLAGLGICLLPGIWLQFSPRHGLRAFGYVVFFNAMITVRNPIGFDDVGLINGWLAFVLGTAALIVVFRALLPSNPARDAGRLARSITHAVAQLGAARRPPALAVWEDLQMQKALRLVQRLQPMPPQLRREVTDCAFIAIELGRDILRLRLLLADAQPEPVQRRSGLALLAAVERLRRDPQEVASLAAQAARLFADVPTPGARSIAALLHDIALRIEAVPGFLSRDYAVPSC